MSNSNEHLSTTDTQMKQWLEEHLKKLNLVASMEQPEGFTRLGYTEAEWRAMDVFTSVAEQLGLTVEQDEAGNRIARWRGEHDDLPAVALGSHLDTVKNGGGYDGVAGVLCALGAVQRLKAEGFQPYYPVEVICFAAEESSRFGISTIGSKAMSGKLNKEELEKLASVSDEQGVTIEQAVQSCGLTWEKLPDAQRYKDSIRSFMELHIEQGTRIEDAGAQFGVAQAVACPIRLQLTIQGQMSHTGTTPMDKRKDALVAVAPLISMISEEAGRLSSASTFPVVATASTLSVHPNAMNVIPGTVQMGVDIRSVDDRLKERMREAIKQQAAMVEQTEGVHMDIKTLVEQPSVPLDQNMAHKAKKRGEALGYKGFLMESGAGHDVMNMAHRWPAGLIFIPCREGLSHHPEEYASLEDLHMGVELLADHMRQEAKREA